MRCRRTSGTCRRSRAVARLASSSYGVRDVHPQRGPSQLGAYVPELRVETLVEGGAQVFRAAAAAGARLPAALALHHQHMTRAPVGERLVVIEERFAEVEQVAVSLAVSEDFEQGGRATPLEDVVKGVNQRRLAEAPWQPGGLIGGRLEPGEVSGFLQPGQELNLAKLH